MPSNKPAENKIDEVFRFGCADHRSSMASSARGGLTKTAVINVTTVCRCFFFNASNCYTLNLEEIRVRIKEKKKLLTRAGRGVPNIQQTAEFQFPVLRNTNIQIREQGGLSVMLSLQQFLLQLTTTCHVSPLCPGYMDSLTL